MSPDLEQQLCQHHLPPSFEHFLISFRNYVLIFLADPDMTLAGAYVDSKIIHSHLPPTIKKKVKRRTIIRRVASKGFKPERKIAKNDPGPALMKKRLNFAKKYFHWDASDWKANLQAVGDFKDFTWYPRELKPRFNKLRSPWTYMTKSEKKKQAFVRAKRWFKRGEYKKTQKQKVFGLTTSNGKILCFKVPPKPFSAVIWAKFVKEKVGPFLKQAFPRKASYQVLLDGEPLLHAPEAKAAMTSCKITVLPHWPKYSPDLNPQENLWAWAEPKLREKEKAKDTFASFGDKVVATALSYPVASASKLVPSMEKRCEGVAASKGAMWM